MTPVSKTEGSNEIHAKISEAPDLFKQQSSKSGVWLLHWHAGNDSLVAVACDRTSLLAGCVAEAMRIRAPGVAVRMTTSDLAVPLGHGRVVQVSKVR